MIIKAISLTQPWATLMAIGAKKIETRSWRTSHRGIVAIHAAKNFPMEYRRLCTRQPFSSALGGLQSHELPLGKVLAIGQIINCRSTHHWLIEGISDNERAFGDYGPDRFGFQFKDVFKLKTPIDARGSLSLWDWNVPAEGEVAEILTQLGALV